MSDPRCNMRPVGLYIHWPYCLSKCPYCDFNSHVSDNVDYDRWHDGFMRTLDHYADMFQARRLVSIFFGGGTPSLMPVDLVRNILDKVKDLSGGLPDEITLEANPTSVESQKLKALAQNGITRVSLGVQALNDNDLKFLGREHNVADALKALDIARSCFDSVSFDLIYARPEQSLKNWQDELEQALSYQPDHLSLYQLTIEPQTPFYNRHRRGEFQIPDDELAADMYCLTEEMTQKAGLISYEVSNYAKLGHECRHNHVYWRGEEYIGIGPGAHGRIIDDKGRWMATRHHRAPDIWLDHACEYDFKPIEKRDILSSVQRCEEHIMMALRLKDGLDLTRFENQFGTQLIDFVINWDAIQTLEREGYLNLSKDYLRLTQNGRLVLNTVLDFIIRDNTAEHMAISR